MAKKVAFVALVALAAVAIATRIPTVKNLVFGTAPSA